MCFLGDLGTAWMIRRKNEGSKDSENTKRLEIIY
jgi:hypothetical protein